MSNENEVKLDNPAEFMKFQQEVNRAKDLLTLPIVGMIAAGQVPDEIKLTKADYVAMARLLITSMENTERLINAAAAPSTRDSRLN